MQDPWDLPPSDPADPAPALGHQGPPEETGSPRGRIVNAVMIGLVVLVVGIAAIGIVGNHAGDLAQGSPDTVDDASAQGSTPSPPQLPLAPGGKSAPTTPSQPQPTPHAPTPNPVSKEPQKGTCLIGPDCIVPTEHRHKAKGHKGH